MDSELIVSDTPFGSFLQLVELALQQSGEEESTVLIEESPEFGSFSTEWGSGVTFTSPEDLPVMLTARLKTYTSVVWVPLWWRENAPSGARGGASRSRRPRYEQNLQELRPYSRQSSVAVVTPAGVLSSPATVTMREAVFAHWDVLAVIEAEGIYPQADTRFRVTAVVLRAKADQAPPVRMFRIPRGIPSDTVRTDFVRLLKQGRGRSEFGYVLRERPDPGVGLGFDAQDPAIEARRASLSGFGGVVSLDDLYEFRQPIHLAQLKAEWTCTAEEPGAVRILNGRDVRRDGTVAVPGDDTVWIRPPEQFQLAAGDVLVQSIYRASDSGGLVLATVRLEDLPAAAAHTLLIMRPRPERAGRDTEFALRFLRTPVAQTLLDSAVRAPNRFGRVALTPVAVQYVSSWRHRGSWMTS
ncbi:hypothetical protein, partial [Nocardia xishanensis]